VIGDFGFTDETSVDISLVFGFVVAATTVVTSVTTVGTSPEVCVVFDALKPD
jgi:hypothetical protein